MFAVNVLPAPNAGPRLVLVPNTCCRSAECRCPARRRGRRRGWSRRLIVRPRIELHAERRVAGIGVVLRDELVALSSDIGQSQHRGFRQLALDREIVVLGVGQPVVDASSPASRKSADRSSNSASYSPGCPGVGKVKGKRCVCELPSARVSKGWSNMVGCGLTQYRPNGASPTS